MSGVSMPVNRPIGRALIVGSTSTRAAALATLQRHGYTCAEVEDPYAAMAELCRRPLVYRAVVLSLASVYKEELAMLDAIKRRIPHIEVWLTNTDGRHGLMSEAISMGAAGLVSDDGFHRISVGSAAPMPMPTELEPLHDASDIDEPHRMDDDRAIGEAVLTADELRALLQEQPITTKDEG